MTSPCKVPRISTTMKTMETDPWLFQEESHGNGPECLPNVFEDCFKPFEKLPDSASYISMLESKLSKLQGKSGKVKASDLVQGLENTRGQHMRDFVADIEYVAPIDTSDNLDSRQNFPPACVIRRLCPEKQALSIEELQNLVIADELAKITELKEAAASSECESNHSQES